MSIQVKREEAEAVLDSAEMILETYGGAGKKTRELETAIKNLEQELQEPESEDSIEEMTEEVRSLMEDMKNSPGGGSGMMEDGEMMGGGPEDPMGGPGPDDSMPPV
ncbi:MAG: hypothetical protein ABEJ03_01835 [Candidatus Nanohaloarchaea archaeon]